MHKGLKKHQESWVGQAAIGFGVGAFLGQSGDNHVHHHYAHQITLSIDETQPVQVISDGQLYKASILFIPAKVKHQLIMGNYLSLYIDTAHALIHHWSEHFYIPMHVSDVPTDLQLQLQQSFCPNPSLPHGLMDFLDALQLKKPRSPSDKIEQILELLQQGIVQSNIPDRQHLAQVAGLSESRFSHWFREQTGLPLRSYRKWLRLMSGLLQMRNGQALTDTAHQANFADQAHFTRTCIELLGVRPSELSHLQDKIFLIE